MGIELDILRYINQHLTGNDIINNIFRVITFINDNGIIWIIIGVILLCIKKTRKGGMLLLFSLLCGFIINSILKITIRRTRPIYVEDQQLLLDFASKWLTTTKPLSYLVGLPSPTSYSFASGHTYSSFNCATIIFFLNKKSGIFAYILATLIGFSRLFFAVHFPSDVLAGMIFGICTAVIVIRVYKKIIVKKEGRSLCV